MKIKKLQRIVFTLKDGRKKYATHNGTMLTWDRSEIEALQNNIDKYGYPAYTADFAKYDVVVADLRNRYPSAKIIRVTGYKTEDHNLPLRTDIIF